MTRILIISLSDVGRDPRVARQIDALREEHDLVVAAYGPPDCEEIEFVRLTSGTRESLLTGAFHMARSTALRGLRRFDRAYETDRRFSSWRREIESVGAELLLVNDAIMLPAALEGGNGALVVFDAHEYAPTQHQEMLRFRLLIAPLTDYICRKYLPVVHGIMVVSEGIGRLYGSYTGVEPVLVTNAPAFARISPRPVGDPIRLIHFGVADPQRRLESMIELMKHLDDRFALDLLLVGGESYVRRLQRLARNDTRIRFLPPVPMRQLVEFANAADVGVFLHSGDNPQRRYTLPNKFFEFIQARLAVAIGPSPEMTRIVEQYKCGIVSPTFEPRDLASALAGIDANQLWEYKQNSDAAAAVLNAEHNAPIIREVIARALLQRRRSLESLG